MCPQRMFHWRVCWKDLNYYYYYLEQIKVDFPQWQGIFLNAVISNKMWGERMTWNSVCCVYCARSLPFPPLRPPTPPSFALSSLPQRQTCADECNRLTCPLVSSWVCPVGSSCGGVRGGSTVRSCSVFLSFVTAEWPWAGCIIVTQG